jgi:hypothetical protein
MPGRCGTRGAPAERSRTIDVEPPRSTRRHRGVHPTKAADERRTQDCRFRLDEPPQSKSASTRRRQDRPNATRHAVTRFVDGTGPVWSGALFPFLFITIACGAVSGFHALISSGTTPKLIDTEANARFIGYGGMLMESFVAIMALVSASIIEPGIYFTMNSPSAQIGTTAESAAAKVSEWGFAVTPQ